MKIPKDKRAQVAELLTRINYDLDVGNFELGFDKGELYFRSSVDLEKTTASKTTYQNLLNIALDTPEKCLMPGHG